MSRVLLIAANKPLPLCDRQAERTKTVTIPMDADSKIRGKTFSVTAPAGFKIEAHSYYRQAVDELGYTIKPYQYELHLEVHEDDLATLKSYLTEHFTSGEEVELWNLWVGSDRKERPLRYRGTLSDFDLDTLEQFLTFYIKDNKLNQCCITIVI